MKNFDISEIDSNFKGDALSFEGMKTFNALEKPFSITGVSFDGEQFVRMPKDIAESVNSGVAYLYANTSGGRIRFITDSTKITLTAILPQLSKMDHMPSTGSSCFDLYAGSDYIGPFRSPYKQRDDGLFEGSATIKLKTSAMRDITINFPLYNCVSAVYISLDENSVVACPKPEKHQKPVVFYGSSITQGGCASHPGNAYANILSRRLDANIINLGFSGNCKGEPQMAEYISTLDMSAFVYDYDHNAYTVEHLEKTHENFFKIMRKNNPDLNIIIVTAANYFKGDEKEKRKEIIYRTYENAVRAGDSNVFFIDGYEMYKPVGEEYCTVDGCHPNDLGFFCMANSVEKVLADILNKKA